MDSKSVIAAFSEDQASRLTGLSVERLRYWYRTEFYVPAYVEENSRLSFSRIYSFKDIVALRVLCYLRNDLGVSLQHLRDVSAALRHINDYVDDELWTTFRLWVLNKKVVWQEPGTALPQEIASRQYLAPAISLGEFVHGVQASVHDLKRDRDSSQRGVIQKNKAVIHNVPVIAGTRIPVSAIRQFHSAGYSDDEIIAEYPDLTKEDVQAALNYSPKAA